MLHAAPINPVMSRPMKRLRSAIARRIIPTVAEIRA